MHHQYQKISSICKSVESVHKTVRKLFCSIKDINKSVCINKLIILVKTYWYNQLVITASQENWH